MTFEEIKSFFKNNQKSGLIKEIRKEFNKSNEIQALIKDGHTEKDLIYFFRNDITPEKHFCKICGKQVHIKDKITKGFRETCSAKCAQIVAQPKQETTMVEKCETEDGFQNDEIGKKNESVYFEKIEVSNISQPETPKQNIIKTNPDQSFEKIEQLEFSKPNFKREDWKGHNKTNFYPWICNICGKYFISQFFKSEPKCPDCFRKTSKISSGENELYSFLKSIYDGEIIRNTRLIADGKELDIYLPEIKVAFEYNGKYFHTTAFRPDKNYHNKKFQICRDKGIKLIQIWDSEWLSKKSNELKETIKKFLKNNLKFPESEEFVQDNMKPFFSENELNEHGYQYFGAIPINCEIIFEKFELYDAGKTIYKKVKNNGRNH